MPTTTKTRKSKKLPPRGKLGGDKLIDALGAAADGRSNYKRARISQAKASSKAKRKCTGKTKAGKPCRAAPLKNSDTCIGHSDREIQEKTGFGGKQAGAGRPRKPHAVEMLKERIEQNIDAVLDPLWEGLRATKAVIVSSGGNTSQQESEVKMVPDYPTRIAAARELLDRGYGKSKSISEVTVLTRSALEQGIEEMEAEMANNDEVPA